MIRTENATLLDSTLQKLLGVIDTKMAGLEARLLGVIDTKLAGLEARLMKEISALPGDDETGAEQEAKRSRRSVNVETGSVGMEKSARDHAVARRHDDEERHTVVFSGFPAKSRKKLLIDYVKLQLLVVERLGR